LIQCRRSAGQQGSAQNGVQHQQIIRRARSAQVETHQRRQQYEQRQPRLGQVTDDRNPALFNSGCALERRIGRLHSMDDRVRFLSGYEPKKEGI